MYWFIAIFPMQCEFHDDICADFSITIWPSSAEKFLQNPLAYLKQLENFSKVADITQTIHASFSIIITFLIVLYTTGSLFSSNNSNI